MAKAFQAMEIRISFGKRIVNPFVARHYPTVGHAFFSAADEKADDLALALGTEKSVELPEQTSIYLLPRSPQPHALCLEARALKEELRS